MSTSLRRLLYWSKNPICPWNTLAVPPVNQVEVFDTKQAESIHIVKCLNLLALCIIFICTPSNIEATDYKGTIFFGPEAMYFIECGSHEKWWLSNTAFRAVGWHEVIKAINSQPECSMRTWPCELQRTVVEGDATLSVTGSHGHLGMYKREISFSELSVLEPQGECKQEFWGFKSFIDMGLYYGQTRPQSLPGIHPNPPRRV